MSGWRMLFKYIKDSINETVRQKIVCLINPTHRFFLCLCVCFVNPKKKNEISWQRLSPGIGRQLRQRGLESLATRIKPCLIRLMCSFLWFIFFLIIKCICLLYIMGLLSQISKKSYFMDTFLVVERCHWYFYVVYFYIFISPFALAELNVSI